MLTKPPCAMSIWMWTTKWWFWELFCITIHFHIFVCNMIIILNMIFSVCPFSFTRSFTEFLLINDSMFLMLFRYIFWNYLSRLTSLFCVIECIRICESNMCDPGIWTLDINWYIQRLSMVFRPSNTYLPCPGALIPQSIINE